MPRLIEHQTKAAADLADLVDFCRSAAFDPTTEDGITAAAPVLSALGNNRHFLADMALAALKENCRTQLETNSYSPQVLLLHPPEDRFFVRANIWPSRADPVLRSSSPASFFYGTPHDHAFDFLTLGYLGPGYWSDYYEVEPDSVAGLPGEAADLHFIERAQLSPGKMLLYRANRDIHDQAPPESLSVSINVMPLTAAQGRRRQYLFDVGAGRIVQDMTVTSAALMLGLSVRLGSGNGRDLAEDFLCAHPDPRMSLAAYCALDGAAGDPDARHSLAERAASCPSALVATHAQRTLELLRNGPSPAAGPEPAPLASVE